MHFPGFGSHLYLFLKGIGPEKLFLFLLVLIIYHFNTFINAHIDKKVTVSAPNLLFVF